MTYQEFTQKFKYQTETLSYEKQLVLAISICKRLFFDYQIFSEENNWGNPDLLLDTITYIAKTNHLKVDESLIKAKTKDTEAVTPDTEDFQDASYALNSCTSVLETLDFLIDHKAEHIYAIGTFLTDTVYSRIRDSAEINDSEIDNSIEIITARDFLLGLSR